MLPTPTRTAIRGVRLLAALLLPTSAACTSRSAQARSADSARAAALPATPHPVPAGGLQPEDGQWIRPAKDYASTRYSGLDQITTANAKQLRLAWTFSTGFLRGHEAAPIVVNNTMYIVTPYPNVLYALDLTKGGALKWAFHPPNAAAAQGVACCDVVNRGAVYDAGKIFYNLLDGHTVAVDAATGKQVWMTKVADISDGESLTMAPLVVRGKVLVGNSGGEFGIRGWLTALDENSGNIAWRGYSTGPDSEVLIGAEYRPFYPQDRGKDLGVKTWGGDTWKTAGGGAWGWISYDPQLDLIYYGSANPGPWNPDQRPGDNKFTSTLFARDPETGHVHWIYQTNPHDEHDYDDVNEHVLLDMPLGGQTRKVLVHPDRNGYMYVVDRATGQVLSAKPFVYQTTIKQIDLRTGRPIINTDMEPQPGRVVRGACPASPGGKDWQPSAYSPRTGLMYVPTNNLCQDVEASQANYISGTPFVGMTVKMYAGPGGNRGEFEAWDPVANRKVWGIKERFPVWSGVAVTAGDVAFYGTMDGWLKAVDARTGQLLWQFKTGSGIIGQPVVYRGPDGKEYVAVLSGVGGWAGAVVSGDMDTRDGTAALGFANAMSDLPQYTTKGGMLYVFSLP